MEKRPNPGLTRQLAIYIIIVQLFAWCRLWSLDPHKPVQQYLLDKWEIAGGIPSNTVLSINQTPDGYLWIGTSRGLTRFDGMKFVNNPLDEKKKVHAQEIRHLFLDRQGTLWIGSSRCLTLYRCQTGQSKTFGKNHGITCDGIRRIKDDMKGNTWISFNTSYVMRLSGSNGKFTAYNSAHGLWGKKINAIVEDRSGNLLFGSREKGVFIYENGKFSQYPLPGLDDVFIITMHEDRDGELWIGTNKGLFRVTGENSSRAQNPWRYTAGEGLSNDWITAIMEDNERNLWVGTAQGLDRIKKKQNGAIDIQGLAKPLPINCLFEDREGSLWIGTDNSGLWRLKDGKFIPYQPFTAHPGIIPLSLFQDRHGDAWIGAFDGKLFRCRGDEIIESLEIPGLSSTGILSIAEDAAGSLWLGTNGEGVFHEADAGRPLAAFLQFTARRGLADGTVISITRDSQDNLWFCTFDGVSVIRSCDGLVQSFKSGDGLSGKVARNVYESKNGDAWIAADGGITVLRDGKITKQNIDYYLPGISVTCIYEDPSPQDPGGVYWIATDGEGLKRLSLTDGAVTSYTIAGGMPTNFIYQFLEDTRGNFWLMSDSGILRVEKNELNRFADSGGDKINCISYGISDGMESLEFDNKFSRNSALKTNSGELLFITRKGISTVNPAKIRPNKTPPPVVIEALSLDRRTIPLHPDTKPVLFKAVENISFHFTAPTFLSPGKIKFQYRLEGFDREWISLLPGQERAAHYKDLPPGAYTFRVIACNAEGVWNRDGASQALTLKPSLYQTLLFKIAVPLLLAALATAAFYIFKKRKLLFEKKAAYKGPSMNPCFAEECVTRLKYLMEIEKLYCDAGLSLHSLAEKMTIPPHLLSQLLNKKLEQNFADFINSYRIEEAKKILQSPRGARQKISTTALQVGFNTMAAFYKVFKKHTGTTPTTYRKKQE
jgi:ligand-binding sensor domain-containing protein/AraC-like DNA-binding protein